MKFFIFVCAVLSSTIALACDGQGGQASFRGRTYGWSGLQPGEVLESTIRRPQVQPSPTSQPIPVPQQRSPAIIEPSDPLPLPGPLAPAPRLSQVSYDFPVRTVEWITIRKPNGDRLGVPVLNGIIPIIYDNVCYYSSQHPFNTKLRGDYARDGYLQMSHGQPNLVSR